MGALGIGTSTLAGLGCGLLAASAVAASRTPDHLAANGAKRVRIAFRLVIHGYEVSSILEALGVDADATENSGWAYVAPEPSAEDVQTVLDPYSKRVVS